MSWFTSKSPEKQAKQYIDEQKEIWCHGKL
jgi:hypothetical protein